MTAAAFQASLLDCAADGRGRARSGGLRPATELTDGAWVDLRPALDRRRRHPVRAAARRRAVARRAAADVRPGGRRPPAAQLLRRGRARCPTRRSSTPSERSTPTTRAELGEPFATAGLCLYRDGRDSVAWHGDRIGRGDTAGHDGRDHRRSARRARCCCARAAAAGGRIRHDLGHGDLLVMGGSCQRTWEHAVPKTARPVGPRISVQFRPRGVR